ncbi:MAG: YjgP/YjgQ family permease [Chitinophagaceae bacterium]|nr:MAG: YjgP/YjgQ family permease [Chitinophagaceae bacterium]
MKKVDVYILKMFLVTFFFSMVLFTFIAIAVDASEHTQDFVKSGQSFNQIVANYYIGFVPYIWGLLFPLFVFIAVIYFTSRMAARSEIVAILAGGSSYNRFLRPYILGGIILAALLFLANREFIPKGNEIRGNFQVKYLDGIDRSGGGSFQDTYYRRSDSNSYLGIRYYDSVQKSAGGFFLHRTKDNKVVYNLRAEGMKWDTAQKNWQLTNAVERKVTPEGEIITRLSTLNLNLNIKPSDLKKDKYLKDKLTTTQLKSFIQLEELRGSEGLNTLKVERFRRSATPVSVILLTLIGAVIASRKNRGGGGLHIATGFIIASLFILTDRFSSTFSIKGNFPPLLAAWTPNLIFSVVALWFYKKAQK